MVKTEKKNVVVVEPVTLTVPQVVKSAYADAAGTSGLTAEDLMADRLASCVDHTSARPIYFNDEERRKLELLAGRQFKDAADFNKYFEKAFKLKIDEVIYTMDPLVRDRMLDRCFGRPLEGVIKEALDEFFAGYVML